MNTNYIKNCFLFLSCGDINLCFFSYLIYKSNYEMISQSSTQVLNQIENNVKNLKVLLKIKK